MYVHTSSIFMGSCIFLVVVLATGICAAVGAFCIGIFGLLSAFYVSLTFRPTSLNTLKSRTYTLIAMIILSCGAGIT